MLLTTRMPFGGRQTVWRPVPADLARRRDRADAVQIAWRRWMGDGEIVYCNGSDERGPRLALHGRAGGARDPAAMDWS